MFKVYNGYCMEVVVRGESEALRPPLTIAGEMIKAAKGWDIPGVLSGALELSQQKLTPSQEQWLRNFGKENPDFRKSLRQVICKSIDTNDQKQNTKEAREQLKLANILGIADPIDDTDQEESQRTKDWLKEKEDVLAKRDRETMSRRSFLGWSARSAAAGVIALAGSGVIGRLSAPEENLDRYSCLGQFIITPDIFKPGGEKPSDLKNIPLQVGIKGYGSNFRFAVVINGENYEVPIGQINVVRGEPLAEGDIRRNNSLGIRVDDPRLIKEAARLGVGKVRINVDSGDLSKNNDETKRMISVIQEAKSKDLEIVLVFHPDGPLENQELERRLSFLFSERVVGNYQKVAIELGNEPDNTRVAFWKGRDLKTFAAFVKQSTDIIWSKLGRKETQIIIGALVWEGNITALLNNLQSVGFDLTKIDPKKLILAVHAYNTVEDVVRRMNTTKAALAAKGANIPIWITELGRGDEDKTDIVGMIDKSKQLGVSTVLIHELPNYENFGYWDMTKGKPTPYFWLLQYYSHFR